MPPIPNATGPNGKYREKAMFNNNIKIENR